MDPSDTIDQSRELARLALGFLESHAIPADPRTFTLGYAYYDGTNPELKTEVDHLIAAGAFNRRSCGRLYEDIFGVDAEARAIRDASGMIEDTLSRVLETMSQAGKDVETYGKVLEDFNGKVGNEAAAVAVDTDIRGAIESIMAETRKMSTRSSTLEKRFADNSEEIVELRRNLDEMRTAATTDALTMAECVRGRDFVARYGGEEFVVLLPKTGLEGSFAVAENIRNTISSKRLMLKSTGKTLGMVTLSFGVAQFKPGETLEELITRADTGLYAAKKHGRNRVESTEPLASEIRRVAMRG